MPGHESTNRGLVSYRHALQHAKQAAIELTDEPGRMQAKTVILAEVEQLRWRIWNGKAKNARRSIDRIRIMHLFNR